MAHFLITARLARRHIATARELRGRWDALPPAQQEATRAELDRLTEVLRDVGRRMSHGPREFRREYDAAKAGVEIVPGPPPPSLGDIVQDLGAAISALRRAMGQAAQPDAPTIEAPPG